MLPIKLMGKAQALKKYLIYLGENLTPWQSHQQSICREKVFNPYIVCPLCNF